MQLVGKLFWVVCFLLLTLAKPNAGQSGAYKTLWERLQEETSSSWFVRVCQQINMQNVLETWKLTLFVPTDAAFQALPLQKRVELSYRLEKLYYVVLQHFSVDRYFPSNKLRDGLMLDVSIDRRTFVNVRHRNDNKTDIWIQGAKVIKKDIFASNGVMYIIDRVLFPSDNSLTKYAARKSDLSSFNYLLKRSYPRIPTGFTLFAPSNGAFQKLSAAGREILRKDKSTREKFLKEHFVPYPLYYGAMLSSQPEIFTTMAKTRVKFSIDSKGGVIHMLQGNKTRSARITKSDVIVTNGVVHFIDMPITSFDVLFVTPTTTPPKTTTTKPPTTTTRPQTTTKKPPTTKQNKKPPAEPSPEPTTAEIRTAKPTAEPQTQPQTEPPSPEPTTAKMRTAKPTTEPQTQPQTEPPSPEPTTAEMRTAKPTTEPQTQPQTEPPRPEPTTAEMRTAKSRTEPQTKPQSPEPTTAEMRTAKPTTEPQTQPQTEPPRPEPTTAEMRTAKPTTEPQTQPQTEPPSPEPTTAEMRTAKPTAEPQTEPPSPEPTTAETRTGKPTTEPQTELPSPEPITMEMLRKKSPSKLQSQPQTVADTRPPKTKEVVRTEQTTQPQTVTRPNTTKRVVTTEPTTQPPTVAPTQPPTVAHTQPLTAKEVVTAEPTTQPPTVAPTQPPTTKEVVTTERATEPPTVADTRPPSTKNVITSDPTQQITFAITEAPTQLPITNTMVTMEPTTQPQDFLQFIDKPAKKVVDPGNLPTIDDFLTKHGLTLFLSFLNKYPDIKDILSSDATKFAIFAPLNTGFFEMEAVDQRRMFKDDDYAKLILKHHIVPRELDVNEIRFEAVKTLAGRQAMIRSFDRRNTIDNSRILQKDLSFKKGNLNIIDRYLIPIDDNLFGIVRKVDNPSIAIFRRLLERAGQIGLLERPSKSRLMLWVPTDESFYKLKPETVVELFTSDKKLCDLINYHITPGYFGTDLMTLKWVYAFETKANGQKLKTRKLDNTQTGLSVFSENGQMARSVKIDMIATNGIMYIIDTVLFPPKMKISGL